MRITHATLLKNAHLAADQMIARDRRLVCIYLTGSLLLDEPLLGGTTDIDLFVVHSHEPMIDREMIRLTDEIHLDISHISQEMFNRSRHLRTDTWLGSFICRGPVILHDTQHWFEFMQARICSQFMQPENTLRRVRPVLESARGYWFGLNAGGFSTYSEKLMDYLKALENAANVTAILTGIPLSERRFILNFPEKAKSIGHPELVSELLDLYANVSFEDDTLRGWLASWEKAYHAANKYAGCPANLNPCRLLYYQRAIETLGDESPGAALWLLLRTWTQCINILPLNSPSYQFWLDACQYLELDEKHLGDRIIKLDSFLDHTEEILDTWAEDNGITA